MKTTLLRLFGLNKYVRSLQMINEHLSTDLGEKQSLINKLTNNLNEVQENGKKLYSYNHELKADNEKLKAKVVELQIAAEEHDRITTELNDAIQARDKRIEDMNVQITSLTNLCNDYSAACDKFVAQLEAYKKERMQMLGRIGRMTQQLKKRNETKNN